jgi:hypothetical protein
MKHTFLAASAATLLAVSGVAIAQDAPADLTTMPPVADDYQPTKTPWGAPDFRGTWPINDFAELPVNRPEQYGDRFFKTEEEMAAEQGRIEQLETAYEAEDESGNIGLGHWIEYLAGSRRTSMVVKPANGRLPDMTPEAQATYEAGRSSWVPGQEFDWVDDFDSWDRCISRGFPASMLPFRYNNGIRIHQSPGLVVIELEMIHDSRIVHVAPSKEAFAELLKTRWPDNVRTWMGQSLGYWEDENTLVIETTNIVAGDSATEDPYARSASPLNMATRGVPPYNTIPMSEEAKVVERLTMIGPDTLTYEQTYSDPKTFTAPYTLRVDWNRDESYEFFEYACHEGNVQVRNYINSSRAMRGLETSGVGIHSGNSEPGGE